MLQEELSGKIIKAFYAVANTLGYGFLEKVYENALVIELKHTGVSVERQQEIDVWYHGCKVGEFCPDVIIDKNVILELKAAKAILPEHEAQLLNYLRATNIEVGFIMNFGPKPEFRRRVFSNARKLQITR